MFTYGILFVVLGLCASVNGGALLRGWRRPLAMKRQETPSPTTQPPTPSTKPFGCEYNGRIYPPGHEFGENYDAASNWCSGMFCSERGEIIYWDNFNCKTTRTTTTPRSTTIPTSPTTTTPTSSPTTTVQMCEHNGNLYPPNTYIDSGYDSDSDWCYGTYCDGDATLLAWDTWNCKKSTSSTTAETTSPSTPTTTQSSSGSSGGSSWANTLNKLKTTLKNWLKGR